MSGKKSLIDSIWRYTSEYIDEVRLVVDWLVFTRFNTQSAREYRHKEMDPHEWRTICILTMGQDYITILILIPFPNLSLNLIFAKLYVSL